MNDEVIIDKVEWSAPEYTHRERTNDWFWTVSVLTIVACGFALWSQNYIFAIFLALSGLCLIIFTVRHPREVDHMIETKGFTMGKRDFYEWKKIKGFNVKDGPDDRYVKLLIETTGHFLPIHTIPVPKDKIAEVKMNLFKLIPKIDIDESQSTIFAEKIGL